MPTKRASSQRERNPLPAVALLVMVGPAVWSCAGEPAPPEEPAAESATAPAASAAAPAPAHDPDHEHGPAAASPAEPKVGTQPLAALLEQLESGDEEQRERAVRDLGRRGGGDDRERALAALQASLGDSSANVRMATVKATGAFDPAATEAIPALIGMFDDPASYRGDCGCVIHPVRIEAARALRRIGEPVLPSVLAQMKHEQASRRECATLTLGELGQALPGVMTALIAALEDEDKLVRERATDALKAIGPDASSAIPALERATRDPVKRVSSGAKLALESIRQQ